MDVDVQYYWYWCMSWLIFFLSRSVCNKQVIKIAFYFIMVILQLWQSLFTYIIFLCFRVLVYWIKRLSLAVVSGMQYLDSSMFLPYCNESSIKIPVKLSFSENCWVCKKRCSSFFSPCSRVSHSHYIMYHVTITWLTCDLHYAGSAMSSAIGKLMVDMLMESASYIEDIMTFFNMFVKLNDFSTAKAFRVR